MKILFQLFNVANKINFKYSILSIYLLSLFPYFGMSQQENTTQLPVREHHIIIEQTMMTIKDKEQHVMTINGTIPGPTLEFTEGDYAVIHVQNNMDVETSVHWHGLLLPNYQDGVPYLTTPPIPPGEEFTYEFPIRQSGTYWYHSHTMLQEQKGLYGSIVIHPKKQQIEYDKELVIMLSDWTNERPMTVLKNLKRRNEWYQIKKETAVPFSRVVAEGAVGAQLKMWRDRMEGADIADIAYDAFLSNGNELLEYPELQPGETIRVRMINGAASTIFWVSFGGSIPTMIANDGIDIEPVQQDKLLFAIAETYDFIVEIPQSGKLEILATAQDGSGSTSTYLGSGNPHPAPKLIQPNKVKIMQNMASMDMKMGAPALLGNKDKWTPEFLKEKYGMNMDHSMHQQMNHDQMDHSMHNMNTGKMDHTEDEMENGGMSEMNHVMMEQDEDANMNHTMHVMGGTYTYDEAMNYANYDYLKAKENTSYDASVPVTEHLLNLTGNMNRYVWSLNGIPLSEADKIKIEGDQVTRITLNNMTMMHHPMHLHGHFFRVINKHGKYSPLKHTVNVPPMEEITIEFYNGEDGGDWFFHCHVLYHMMSGMTRIFSYDTPRDPRMQQFSAQTIINETDHLFNWNTAEIGSQMAEMDFTFSTMRNEWNVKGEYGYDENLEVDATYNRYLNSFVRLFGGVSIENEEHNSLENLNPVGVAGIKWFSPYMFTVEASLDHQIRPKIGIDRELLLFPRTFFEGEFSYRADFGVVNELHENASFEDELEWSTGLEYMLGRDVSIKGNYHNQFGWGAGVVLRY